MDVLSKEEFLSALPDQVRKNVNQTLVDQINHTLGDPDMYEQYRNNLLSYTSVMQEGRFKITDYVNAVKYVSNKLMGHTNAESYRRTFPEKYADWIKRGVPQKDMASHITAYNKTKLVNLIYGQTLIPIHVLNQDLMQEALNTQAELMRSAKSEMVRTNAANSLLNHLRPPETKKIELDIAVSEHSAIDALRQSTMELVAEQRKAISAGALNAKNVAESRIIQGEARDVTPS